MNQIYELFYLLLIIMKYSVEPLSNFNKLNKLNKFNLNI